MLALFCHWPIAQSREVYNARKSDKDKHRPESVSVLIQLTDLVSSCAFAHGSKKIENKPRTQHKLNLDQRIVLSEAQFFVTESTMIVWTTIARSNTIAEAED